jgi:hypothetical protein
MWEGPMAKALKPYANDDWTISFDSQTFIKSCLDASVDLANGRISLAEARALHREQRDALKQLKAVLMCGQLARRASKIDWK